MGNEISAEQINLNQGISVFLKYHLRVFVQFCGQL